MTNPKGQKMTRRESGILEDDGDWPGIFIRGDRALMGYLPALRIAIHVLENHPDICVQANTSSLHGLADLLESCRYDRVHPPSMPRGGDK